MKTNRALDIVGGVIVYGSIAVFVWIVLGAFCGAAVAAGHHVFEWLT